MGLLDDAIREHLELKRRSGADPGAIARAEHDALDPIFPDEPPAGEADAVALDGAAPVAPVEPQAVEPIPEQEPQPRFDEQPAAEEAGDGFSAVGQETAELDMSSVLGQDAPSGEAFEWDAAASSHEGVPEEIPGQERLTFE